MPTPPERCEPGDYTEDYFLTCCDGYAEYLAADGQTTPQRLEALWRILRPRPGLRVLDVACGRGELVARCGSAQMRAVGIDRSPAALGLAQDAIRRRGERDGNESMQADLALADAQRIPFRTGAFDRAIMSDLVEHLLPEELRSALLEVHRVLAPGGQMLIHTMPNLWYYRYGYPMFRLVERLRGRMTPRDPRNRLPYARLHVNEQSPCTLRRALADSPFRKWRVWLHDYRDYRQQKPLMRISMRLATRLPVIKLIFCDDIFAIADK